MYTVYDTLRNIWLTLTPEEWVRQHVLSYLIRSKDYPLSSIQVEVKVVVNEQPQRADIVAYTRQMTPFLLVECKAAHVPLSEETLWQAQIYNQVLCAPYVALCNGMSTLLFEKSNDGLVWCGEDFPEFGK